MDALRYLPENNPQTYRLLVKISTQLQQMNRLEEAMEYVEKLNPLLEQNPEHPLAIPILIEKQLITSHREIRILHSSICTRQTRFTKTILMK